MSDLPENGEENAANENGIDAQDVDAGAQDGVEAPQEIGPDTIIEALQAENADLKDRILRAVAEMENLRKRTQREVADARNYAIANFARDMLEAMDNLERALQVLSAESREQASADMKSLIEGIEMTEREMQRLMQKNGVKPILAANEKFDPHKHQAMFEVPDASVAEGTVVQVMQTGFEIGERVLRPAMVGVSKGGPKMSKAAPAEPTPESNEAGPEGASEADGSAEVHIDKEV